MLVPVERFDPATFSTFRFTERTIDDRGRIRLGYRLDDAYEFVEEFTVPMPAEPIDRGQIEPILQLLHWVAGVSYYKTAAPPSVACETGTPPPACSRLLEALYSEGLGEFAVVNALGSVPHPRFPSDGYIREPNLTGERAPRNVLVPIGGGKDSIVALEIVRRSGLAFTLFSVRDDPAMQRTAAAAQVPRLVADRALPFRLLGELNDRGALNGHVPITAIIACVSLLVASLHRFDAVALANERSASSGNVDYNGVKVNHQFSKSWRAEQLLRAASAEVVPEISIFSVLRPASELAIARRFAQMPEYHRAFTSCNAIFRLDPALRRASWCGDCPKCRFVFLIMAPFMEPCDLADVFGTAMLDDERQYEGFALLTATGGHKPFECVGEEDESLAAIELLGNDPRWRDRPVVRRLVDGALGEHGRDHARINTALTLSSEHAIPKRLAEHVDAFLGS